MALYFRSNITRVAQQLSKIVYQCGAGIHAAKRIISKRRFCNGNSTSRSYFFRGMVEISLYRRRLSQLSSMFYCMQI